MSAIPLILLNPISIKGIQNSIENFKLPLIKILSLNETGIPEVKFAQNRERIFNKSEFLIL
jgi:hypothetical protein